MLQSYLRSCLAALTLLLFVAQPGCPGADRGETDTAATTGSINRPIADKWAIVVGLSKFADSSIPRMKYSKKNAKDFASFLINNCNFARDHVLVMLDEKATREAIMKPLGDSWLPRKASKDDLVVVYLSTFVTPANLDAYGESYAAAYDTRLNQLYADGIPIRYLPGFLSDRVASERIVLIIDAPHSGVVGKSRRDLYGLMLKRTDIHGKVLVLCSSGAREKSWNSVRYPNSVFTGWLMSTIDKTSNLKAAYEIMKSRVAGEVKADFQAEQNPVMAGSGSEISIKTRPACGR